MTQQQINRLEMFQATLDHMNTSPEIWNAIPVIGNYKNLLTQLIQDIKVAAGDQEASRIFLSTSQRQLKKQISDKMDILDDILESYALDTDNAELIGQAANSYSDYFKLSNENFEIKVSHVISLMETYLEQMADYGATTAQIEDVQLDMNLFMERRGKPRSYKIASKVATKSLGDLFKEATPLLKKLDNVIKRFKRSNISFYNGYTSARQIIDK